jgi:hypothetical protein
MAPVFPSSSFSDVNDLHADARLRPLMQPSMTPIPEALVDGLLAVQAVTTVATIAQVLSLRKRNCVRVAAARNSRMHNPGIGMPVCPAQTLHIPFGGIRPLSQQWQEECAPTYC